MAENPHYRELLRILNECGVEYLIVGGYAVMKYTEPRYTKDLDLWVRNSPENAERLYRALAGFGAPLGQDGITSETFIKDSVVYQIGVAPVRIDISTHIDGVAFDAAWRNRVESKFFGLTEKLALDPVAPSCVKGNAVNMRCSRANRHLKAY